MATTMAPQRSRSRPAAAVAAAVAAVVMLAPTVVAVAPLRFPDAFPASRRDMLSRATAVRGSSAHSARRESADSNAATPSFVGVNLGNFMVVEGWMDSAWWNSLSNGSVPVGQGEYQLCAAIGRAACTAALTAHWDTWFAQADVEALAAAGVTHCRIPVGYWMWGPQFALPNDTYVIGGWPYLQRLLGWLSTAGLHAVVDLHGAPGSQNGHDNSGNSAGIGWDTPSNINATVAVLAYMAANFTALNSMPGYEGVVSGIEVLNEPWTTAVGGPIAMSTLQSFTAAAVAAIRDAGFTGDVWFPDGWDASWSGWVGFLTPPAASGVYMDSHLYRCFGGYDDLTVWGQSNYSCAVDLPRLAAQVDTVPIIVGEYSLCIPNAPDYPYSLDGAMAMRAFAEAQLQAYGAVRNPGTGGAAGAFFWAAKVVDAPLWSYQTALASGTMPDLSQNLTQAFFDCGSI